MQQSLQSVEKVKSVGLRCKSLAEFRHSQMTE